MPQRFLFETAMLETMVGGRSAIDSPKLNLHDLNEAYQFLKSYGFDIDNSQDAEKLWYYHRRSLVLLTEKLGFNLSEVPETLRDRKSLQDLRKLLLWASSSDPREKELRRWSCALLRAMHVFVHAENDLFSTYAEEIQKQILGPFQSCIVHDGTNGETFLKALPDTNNSQEAANFQNEEKIRLIGFEVKPFKTSSSTVIKLLAKPDALAMSVFDKLGLRFITQSMFDCFRVIRFLVQEHLISFPHIIPDQAHNNLYPLDLFIRASHELRERGGKDTDKEADQFYRDYFEKNREQGNFLKKENLFSGADYRSIKFICRRLIRIESEHQDKQEKTSFSFFYPFEVQIMDGEAHQKILSGPSHHHAYKERQRVGARKRLFQESEL